MRKIILILILSLIVAGCAPCYEKEGSCCKGEYCMDKEVTCIEGMRPLFTGCSKDCEPQVDCVPIQNS